MITLSVARCRRHSRNDGRSDGTARSPLPIVRRNVGREGRRRRLREIPVRGRLSTGRIPSDRFFSIRIRSIGTGCCVWVFRRNRPTASCITGRPEPFSARPPTSRAAVWCRPTATENWNPISGLIRLSGAVKNFWSSAVRRGEGDRAADGRPNRALPRTARRIRPDRAATRDRGDDR